MTDKARKAHNYLQQIRNIALKIDALNVALQEIEEQNPANVRAVQYDAVKVQTSPKSDTMTGYIAIKERYQKDLLAVKVEYTEKQNEAIKRIHKIPNGLYVDILTRRYVAGQKWVDIADNLNFILRWTHTLGVRAMEAFTDANQDLW